MAGITNGSLRTYGKSWFGNSNFRSALIRADKFKFSPKTNSSTFWTGMGENGKERVAKNYVRRYGGASLETTLDEYGISRMSNTFDWNGASTSLAIRSSGEVKLLIGSTPWPGSVWNLYEKVLLGVNPKITGIKEIYGVVSNYNMRVLEIKPLLASMGTGCEGLISLFNAWLGEEE